MTDLIKKVEAVLFAAGRMVLLDDIARFCNATKEDTKKTLFELKQQYEQRESPLLLIEEGDGWKLTVGEKYLDVVKEIVPTTELTKQVLETLAVIAWKQPILQSEVVNIRTNKAYEHIAELEKLGFITKIKKGRSYLLKPTGRFFDYFDLPEDKMKEVFKDIKDEEEAQQKLTESIQQEKKVEEIIKEKVAEIIEKTEDPIKDFIEENKSPQEVEEESKELKEKLKEKTKEN